MATITTLKSGDYTDTSVWSGGVVPVDGDKVTISKLGTATSRTTSGAISAGASNVPVTAGTGTGLIGEVIEFDSRPGEYYELTTGFTASAGTAVVTPVLAGAIASGATFRNRGHKIKLIGTRVAGDDTSTGFTVNGVLYWDRAISASLQVKGTYTVGASGTEDRGTAIDPITNVNSTLLLNYSAALAIAKYSYTKTAGGRVKHFGKLRTRLSALTAQASATTTSFSVSDATGWAIGDELYIFPTTPGSTADVCELRTVNSVSGTTIGVSAGLTYTHASGAYVANMTSNVITDAYSSSFGYAATLNASTSSIAKDVECENSYWNLRNTNSATVFSVLGSSTAGISSCAILTKCVIRSSATSVGAINLSLGGSVDGGRAVDCISVCEGSNFPFALNVTGYNYVTRGAYFSTSSGGRSISSGFNNSNPSTHGEIVGALLYAHPNGAVAHGQLITSGGKFLDNIVLSGRDVSGSMQLVCPGTEVLGNNFNPFGYSWTTWVAYSMSQISGNIKLSGTKYYTDPVYSYGSLTGLRVVSAFRSGASSGRVHEIFDNNAYVYSDASTRNRGDAALNVSNRTTSPFVYTFTAAVPNGATKRLVGYLRRNSTYGAGSMPTITLSIPGVSNVVSSVSDTADTWLQTDLSITNTTGSTQEVTVTLSANGAANTSSSAWFDGIPIYPFVQTVRHYGFVFDESNPFRVVNPAISASEATAAAYTGVTITPATPQITVGSGTANTWQKVYDYSQAWAVLNLTETVQLTSTDAQTFSLPLTCKLSWPAMPGDKTLSGGWLLLSTPSTLNYRLSGTKIEFQTAGTYNMSGTVFSGTVELVNTSGGSVIVNVPSGTSYTNTGPNITVSAPSVTQAVTINGLASGSTVQIYDLTNSIELANGTSTTSFSWTDSSPAVGNRDIRVRIAYVSGTSAKEFIEANIGTCGTTSGTESLTYLTSQVDDSVYIANNIDGSIVTGITISDGLDRMLINIAGGSVSWPQIYAYNVYWLSTSVGIQDDGAIITAVDTANYLVSGFMIRNTNSAALSITGGYGRDVSTGTVASLIDTVGSTGNIYQTPDHVVAYATGSGLSPAESAKLMSLPDASDVWVEPKALTVGKFLALK